MDEHPEERETPLWRHVGLLVGFVLVVVAAVFTVLLPELEDDDDEPKRAADTSSASEDEAEAPGDEPTASK